MPLHGFFGVAPPITGSRSQAVAGLPSGMRFDTSSSSSPASTGGNGDNSTSNEGADNDQGSSVVVRRNEWIRSTGKIHSLNTLESLKTLNKNAFLNEQCLPTLLKCCGIIMPNNNDESKSNGDMLDPNVALLSSTCITYCNLKTNITVYWFAFPAIVPRSGCGISYSATKSVDDDGCNCSSSSSSKPQTRLVDAWGSRKCRMLSQLFHQFRVLQEKENVGGSSSGSGSGDEVWCPPFFLLLPLSTEVGAGEKKGQKMKVLPLNKNTFDSLSVEEKEKVVFGFVDPNTSSTSSSSDVNLNAVGWTLRNLVAYLSLCFGLGGCDRTFLSYRSPFLRRINLAEEMAALSLEESNTADNNTMQESYEDVGEETYDKGGDDAGIGQSLLLNIRIPLATHYQWPADAAPATKSNESNIPSYRCVGWELNKNNKAGPRSIDLRPLVSPAHLSRQANDLNLRLMKWRALPSLDVDKLAKMKVLLLGAGTLGCGVARTLLGWGVRKITFADSGRVSYSNPVRQSLFGVEDCKDGGKYKAVAAAESLVTVAGPDVKSEGVVLTIPMPGHAFGKGKDGTAETEAVKKDVERLHRLIEENDVVFLLTDTRESRWLPTVMALATETPLINAALGLDSWLVMRHGPPSSQLSNIDASNNKQRLGCYFCSDVVAPENSTRDRTLDQQCTVTRPGLAPIAASMATELMVAMFHHSLNHCAPAPEQKRYGSNSGAYAPVDDGKDASSSALGRLPHQIRGTVVTYTMMTPTVPAFPSCTACADLVVKEYQKSGFDFVKCVCCDEDGSYLETVSGLATFKEEAASKVDDCFDWDDDDEDM